MQVMQTTARTTDFRASAVYSPYLYTDSRISGGRNRAESCHISDRISASWSRPAAIDTNFTAEVLFVASCRWIGTSRRRRRASRKRAHKFKLGVASEGGQRHGPITCFACGGEEAQLESSEETCRVDGLVKVKERAKRLDYLRFSDFHLSLALQAVEDCSVEGRSAPQQKVFQDMLEHLSGPPPSRWVPRRWVNAHCLKGSGMRIVTLHVLDKLIEEHPFVLIMTPYKCGVQTWRDELSKESEKGRFGNGKVPVLGYANDAEKKVVEDHVQTGEKCIVLAGPLRSQTLQDDLFAKNKDKWTFVLDLSHLLLPQIIGHQDRAYMNRLPVAFPERVLMLSEQPSKQAESICTLSTKMVIRPSGNCEPRLRLVHQDRLLSRGAVEECRDLLDRDWRASSGGSTSRKQAVIFVYSSMEGERLLTKLQTALAEEKFKYDAEDLVHFVTSKTASEDKLNLISKFQDGQFPILITMNMLREGQEFRHVELVMISAADKYNGLFRRQDNLVHMSGIASWSANGRVILGVDDANLPMAQRPQSIQDLISQSDHHRCMQNEAINKEITRATAMVKANMNCSKSSKEKAKSRPCKPKIPA